MLLNHIDFVILLKLFEIITVVDLVSNSSDGFLR